MTRTTINGERFYKRKEGQDLTTEEKRKIEKKEIIMSHYATGYFYYRIIK